MKNVLKEFHELDGINLISDRQTKIDLIKGIEVHNVSKHTLLADHSTFPDQIHIYIVQKGQLMQVYEESDMKLVLSLLNFFQP